MTDATPATAPATYPGKTLGIVALVLAILPFQLLGFILGLVARSQSKAAGFKNTPAKAAIIVSIIMTVLIIIGWVIIAAVTAAACQSGAAVCTVTTY